MLPKENPAPCFALNGEAWGRGQNTKDIAEGSGLGLETTIMVFTGRRSIDQEVAEKLAKFWKMDAKFFLRLQENYDYYKSLGVPDKKHPV